MASVIDILDLFGLLQVTAEARNVLIWPTPDPPAPHPPLVEGPLAHVSGDLTTDNSLRPRLSAILCPDATLAGVAHELSNLMAAITTRTTTAPLPSPQDVSRAMLTYSSTHLGNDYATRIRAGFRVPLPVEIDQVTGNWVTNLESVRLWRDNAPIGNRAALHHAASRLPIPDPDELRLEAAFEIGGTADVRTLGLPLAARVLRNPFEAVFWVVEVFHQVRRERPADEPRLAISMAEAMVVHQAKMLAWTTAGNAILQRMWVALTGTEATNLPPTDRPALLRSRRVVAEGLGLAAVPGVADSWSDPGDVGPTAVLHELRLLPSASPRPRAPALELAHVAAGESPDGMQAVCLGRALSAGSLDRWTDTNSGVVYRGPAHGGSLDVAAFINAHRVEVGATDLNPQLQARVEIVAAIARNEGWLDAARLRDKGMVSTGLQQWTVHVNEEMTVLLEHFRGLSPEHYALFFGLHGLQPRIWTAVDTAAQAPPGTPAVVAANPDADPNVIASPGDVPADPRTHFPRYVTLLRLAPGLPAARMPVGTGNPRFSYFGGTAPTPLDHRFSADWAARVRLASLCSLEYRIAQVQTAAYRFARLLRDAGNFAVPHPPGPAVNYPLSDLFTTQFGAALLLDAHINRPGRVRPNVQQAIAATAGPAHVGGNLRDGWLIDLADSYQRVRQLQDKPQRDQFIINLRTAGTISAQPGSFTGW